MDLTIIFRHPAVVARLEMPPLVAHVPFEVPVFRLALPRPPTGPVYLTNNDWSAYLVNENTGAAITR